MDKISNLLEELKECLATTVGMMDVQPVVAITPVVTLTKDKNKEPKKEHIVEKE